MDRISYLDSVADRIIERMSDGESLRQICSDKDMPALRTVLGWAKTNPEFGVAYAGAQDLRAEHMFQEMLEIADDGRNDWMERLGDDGAALGWRENGEAIRRSQLRIDSRKWILAKMQPKKYGDRQIVESTSEVTVKDTGLDVSLLDREERAELRRLILKAEPVPSAETGPSLRGH